MSVAKANLNNELLDVEVWQICDRTGWYWLVLVDRLGEKIHQYQQVLTSTGLCILLGV
jgi:hypothetical protein